MIKTHLVTGLKYLCYTMSSGETYDSYKGSGTYWKKHLLEHGDIIKTELIFETSSKEEFRDYARMKSIEWNIVESDEWANLKYEEGDGGDTVSNRMWVTDGTKDRYVFKTDEIPDGWNRGRTNCKFKNSSFQQEMSSRVDRSKAGFGIKKAWAEGKFANRTGVGVKGTENPACRKEVRDKISKAVKLNWNSGIYDDRKRRIKTA